MHGSGREAVLMTGGESGGNRQAKRALPTNVRAWRRLRETILIRAMYRCQEKVCGALLVGKGQTHVEHEDGDPNNNDPSNLRILCIGCHSRKTAREGDRRGVRRPDRQRAGDRHGGGGGARSREADV